MFLSFIIPVYNAETYIGECLDSLLQQDIPEEDYEIICVNDGSRDGSLSVLQKFAQKHSNIIILDKENGGVTTARNAGLEASRGDYIWFIDADDFIKANILGQLKTMVQESDCDRLIFGGYQFLDALTEEERTLSQKKQLPTNTPWYDAVVWRSLLRRSFLQSHDLSFRYPELTHGEDGLFMYEVTLHNPSAVEIEEALYFYREHSGSAETTVSVENQMRKLRSYIRITKILQEHFSALEQPTDGSANKLMSFLWMSLYEASKLPAKEARKATKELKKYGLFPYRCPAQCNMDKSYMTDRTDLVGKVFDKVYLNLHTRWGYTAMRLLQKLLELLK